MLDYLNTPAQLLFDPFFTRACVALVYPQMLQTRTCFDCTVEHQWYGPPVLKVGSMHLGSQ
jgi:hypothetical protein